MKKCNRTFEYEMYESNEIFRTLVKKHRLLEDVLQDMLDEEAGRYYEEIKKCCEEIEKIKIRHAKK